MPISADQIKPGLKIKFLGGWPEPEIPEEIGVIIYGIEPESDTFIAQVETDDDDDDGLREAGLDALEHMEVIV